MRHKLYKKIDSDYINSGDMTKTLTNIISEDLSSDCKKVENVTLIIWGEKDKAVSIEDGMQMYRHIALARIEILENVGHFPHLENSKMFLYFLKDFLL